MLTKTHPDKTEAWKTLEAGRDPGRKIMDLFAREQNRARDFRVEMNDLIYDYSRTNISAEERMLLIRLAGDCGVRDATRAMFSGERINETEQRSVLHTALRSREPQLIVDGEDVMKQIREVQDKMKAFSEKVRNGDIRGFSGKPIDTIVNIGIGGSDLGPLMVTEALTPYRDRIQPYFVSNVDGAHLENVLTRVNSETTLFLIASKTFTTLETMTNAFSARRWFMENGGREEDIPKHFVALSTNLEEVRRFGIPRENMFEFWDWVGGRYSLWSAIGLSIALTIGYSRFQDMLNGAKEIDDHFQDSPFEMNIPVLMALTGIWHRNFCNYATLAVLPYSQNLHRFPAYLQQADMESNGKSVDRFNSSINYSTGPVVWGEPGTNGQHAFFQLIHQGTDIIPCDFIGFVNPSGYSREHHDLLMSNFFAQTEALLKGDTSENPHRLFKGNRPSCTLLFSELDPYNLGRLIALYEHKIFVQGIIWNIYSFDQWGVELGKTLAKGIIGDIRKGKGPFSHDPSTNTLMEAYLKMRK